LTKFVDPRSFAVLGANGSFRQSSFDSGFNPTGTTPPFFQIFDEGFLDILGKNASISVIAFNSTNTSFAFAHEGPIYNPSTEDLFFISNDGGLRNIDRNNRVLKLSMKDVEEASRNGTQNVNVAVTEVSGISTWMNLD
jgi:gluconolactonase